MEMAGNAKPGQTDEAVVDRILRRVASHPDQLALGGRRFGTRGEPADGGYAVEPGRNQALARTPAFPKCPHCLGRR